MYYYVGTLTMPSLPYTLKLLDIKVWKMVIIDALNCMCKEVLSAKIYDV